MTASVYAPVIAGLGIGTFFIILFSFSSNLSSGNSDNAAEMSDKVSIVTVPEDSAIENTNFEPDVIKVVIGINNTVRWINRNTEPISVEASSKDDLAFFRTTNNEGGNPNLLMHGESFAFTFAKAGEFSYHSVPHPSMHGTVVVLEHGNDDYVYKKIVEENLKREIENIPLTLNIDKDPSTKVVQVHAIQGFVLENSSGINAYLIYPTWQDNKNPDSTMLTDKNGDRISHDPIFHDALLREFDATCPYTEIKIGDDGSIGGSSTDKETTMYYGSQISVQLDSNVTGVVYYSYGLGTVEPDENGIYRLTFVTPYEAKIRVSDGVDMLSYERSNCAVFDSDLTIPYFDIIFEVDQ